MSSSNTHVSYLDVKDKYKLPILNWFFSVDHKRIGIMYMYAAFTFFVIAVSMGVAIKAEKMFPGEQFYGPALYNKLFTTHSVMMIFLFIIPTVPSIFGNFFLPIMIGAKDVSFPRLNHSEMNTRNVA